MMIEPDRFLGSVLAQSGPYGALKDRDAMVPPALTTSESGSE